VTPTRRIILGVLTVLGTGVGAWAAALPRAFYDAFPGPFFGAWVGADGPFNEHLIRDVGALYLALAAVSLYGAVSRSTAAGRSAGIAWIVFSIPHLLYHLGHLQALSPFDAVAEPIALALTVVLPIPLLIPSISQATEQEEQS